MREASYENPRNAYLDKVVANFMYNRFSRSGIARPNYMAPGGSNIPDAANYFDRTCSSPDMTHPLPGEVLDMEP